MEFSLVRKWFTNRSTIGELTFGDFHCVTLEDRVRAAKIHGETAIRAGRYRVVVTQSIRFGRPMPLLLDVPEFTGIRIHSGNTDKDTDGCILVGQDHGEDVIFHSRDAFRELFPLICNAQPQLWLTITDGPETDARS